MADRSVVYRLKADVTQFRAQMASAAASVGTAADKMTAADKSGAKWRQGLATLGTAAGKVGLVAAAGLGAAVVKAANFDQAMSKVSAATHETAGNMELLRAAALKAGADTAFSAGEAAAGIEALAKAGVATKDVLAGGLAGALDLAAAGELEVGAAAEAAASAMTQFNLKGSDVPHIADLLAAAAGKAQGEVSDMAMALNQSGLVAAQMGVSIEETTGSLAAFASAGLIGSDAGTSLKTMLLRLANPSAEAAAAMERFGISAYDAQGNMRPMVEIAGQLQTAFKGQDQATRDAALATIFGSDAIRAANVLYTQGAGGIQSWIDKVNDQGYAADTASKRMENLKGDLEKFSGSLETALIGTGDGSQGPLRSLIQNLTDVVNAYNKLHPAAQSAVGSVLGVTAAVGGGIWVFSKLVQSASNARAAFSNLGIDAGSTGKKLGGLAARAGGILLLGQAIGALGNSLKLGANINTADLQRDIDLIVAGGTTDSLGELAGALEGINEAGAGTASAIFSIPAALVGMDTSFGKSRGVVEQFDQALAQMVEGGRVEEAEALFAGIREAAADNGGTSDSDVVKSFDSYGKALDNIKGSAESAAGGMDKAAAGADGVATAASAAAQAAEEFKSTIDSLNAVLTGRAGLRDYEASLDDLRKTLQENGNSFDINTGKGRENQQMLDNFTSSTIKVAEGMQGVARQEFLSGAIGDIRTLGRQMGIPKAELRALIAMLNAANDTDVAPGVTVPGAEDSRRQVKALDNQIKGLRGKIVEAKEKGATESSARVKNLRAQIAVLKGKKLDILANTQPARGAVNSLTSWINSLTATVDVQGRKTGGLQALLTPADGVTVPGQRSPYADKTLMLAAPGEEVISNRYGQADRNRALLKAINANRYAGGGTVGRAVTAAPSVSVAAPRVNVGGTTVTVLIDGQEFRGMIVNEIEGREEMAGLRGRAGG